MFLEGWNNRGDLPALLNRNDLVTRGAEVGVEAGAFAHHILKSWPGSLLLVDLWAPSEHYRAWGDQRHEANYKACLELASPRVELLRMDSVQAANFIRSAYGPPLDFVYIDADHSYAGCRRDLEAWSPLIRKGGIISGHDYYEGKHPNNGIPDMVYGVKSAVDEFAEKHGLEVYVTRDDDPVNDWPSWLMVLE